MMPLQVLKFLLQVITSSNKQPCILIDVMGTYVKPSVYSIEAEIDNIAVSGPPADIPSPDVEVVDFGCKASVWDEVNDNYKIKEESYEVYE